MVSFPDKIHYQIFDTLGRVARVLVDSDANENKGKSQSDNGGQTVTGIDQVLQYGYNVKGERISTLRDNNVDGTYDYREAYTLNANGNWVAKEIDLTNDGTFDRKEVYTKDADDGLVKTEFYNVEIEANGNSRDVLSSIEHYEVNANNVRTAVFRDLDATEKGQNSTVNGIKVSGIESIVRYDLDSKGNIKQANHNSDADPGNIIETVEYFVRDANGNIIAKYIDSDNLTKTGSTHSINNVDVNGIDKIETYNINAKGQSESIEYDNNADGRADSIKYYDINPETGFIKGEYQNNDPRENTGYTKDINGKSVSGIDSTSLYERDAKGQLVYGEYDSNADGKPQESVIFVRDDQGRIIQEKRNEDANKLTGFDEHGTDRLRDYILDSYGRIVKYTQTDDLKTMKPNYIELRSYDARDNVTEKKIDNDGNGTTDIFERYTYNEKNEHITTSKFTKVEAEKADGKPYQFVKYTRNPQTGLVEEMYTENDGKPFERIVKDYSTDRVIELDQFYRYTTDGKERLQWQTAYVRNSETGSIDTYFYDYDGDGDYDQAEKVYRDNLNRDMTKDVYKFGDGIPLEAAKLLESKYLHSIEYYTPKEPNSVQSVYYNLDPLAEKTNGTSTGRSLKASDNRNLVGIDKFQELTLDNLKRVIIKREVDDTQNKDQTTYRILNDQGSTVKEYIDYVRGRGNTYEIYGKQVDGIDTISTLELENNGNIRLVNFIDYGANGKTDTILIEQVTSTLDFTDRTKWTEARFADLGNEVNEILISGDKANTTLILNEETVTKLAGARKSLYIKASWDVWPHTAEGNKSDVIKLQGFSDSDKSNTVTQGNATYNVYTKEINEETYNIYIDSDFSPILG
ncbi:hypothetical protein ACERCG_11875 [Mannheimia sp. E30BD]|uniref:hypothetical protein n=1 Tax=Mannheimia sp. E30BD TaxID=3278708 RepID=UPI00359DA489